MSLKKRLMICMVNIDIRDGRCSINPMLDVDKFIQCGLSCGLQLCIIDLDCAISGVGCSKQFALLEKYAGRLWYGGGLQNTKDIAHVLDMGASGVVMGSALYKKGTFDHAMASDIIKTFSAEQIIFSLDCKDGYVVTRGFSQQTNIPISDVLEWFNTRQTRVNLAFVDVNASQYGKELDIDFIRTLHNTYANLHLWYAGNIRSPQQVKALEAIGVHAIIGRNYISQPDIWQNNYGK